MPEIAPNTTNGCHYDPWIRVYVCDRCGSHVNKTLLHKADHDLQDQRWQDTLGLIRTAAGIDTPKLPSGYPKPSERD